MPGSVQSIERAAAVLRLLAAGTGRLGCVEVATSLDLAKGTAHGILRTLQEVGFVEQDRSTGKYQLGPGLQSLAAPRFDPHVLRSLALNWADALAARSGCAVALGVLAQGEVLLAHHGFRPDDTPQAMETGQRRPAHACALGKALLAYDPSAVALLKLRPMTAYTPRTLTGPRELARELAQVRRDGWAVSAEELTMGTAGLAAPVHDRGGLTVAAIGVNGPVEQVCDASRAARPALVQLVQDAARAVSRELAAAG